MNSTIFNYFFSVVRGRPFRSYLAAIAMTITLAFATADANDYPAPVVLKKGDGTAFSGVEYCGNGIDENLDGHDALCSGEDKDRDGYPVGQDCDDGNRFIIPGERYGCSADCGAGTRLCNWNGSWSSCSCSPVCEAIGAGRCFYISALTGSDTNNGSFAAPWKSLTNVISYSGASPTGWVSLLPGDVIYLMTGDYREVVTVAGQAAVLNLVNVQGASSAPIVFKAYPGADVRIVPNGQGRGVYCENCKHIQFNGFEILNAWEQGIRVAEGENLLFKLLRVSGTNGAHGNNVAGYYVGSARDVIAEYSVFYDNFVRGHVTDGNSRNVAIFDGKGKIEIKYSTILNTSPVGSPSSAGCITYKHGSVDPQSAFLVHHNFFQNCGFQGVGSGTNSSHFHHNLMVDSVPFTFADCGGVTNNSNNLIEYNTVINGGGLSYNPTTDYYPIGSLTFRNNVIIDNRVNNTENSIIRILPYGSDLLYGLVMAPGKLNFSNNCYYNHQGNIRFSLFASPDFGPLGALHSLVSWQALGLDSGSANVDPLLNSSNAATHAACSNKGMTVGW